MRLFAAVDPPTAEVAAVGAAIGDPDERLRYVPADQWHLTTAFYGEVPEAAVDELAERLGRAAAKSAPMTLQIRGVGTFPKQAARARVLWAGVEGDVAELIRLAERCAAAGRRVGLRMEERAYRPHFTIARVRKDNADLRETVAALATYVGQAWPAQSLRLVVSRLGPQVRHETIHEWPLPQPSSRP